MPNMTDIDPTRTSLAELVAARPGLASVFDGLGLDFCCHGQQALADACVARGVSLVDALAAIGAAGLTPQHQHQDDWAQRGPVALAEHIVGTHHRYLYGELPELEKLADKVASVHGERHPELAEVCRLVSELQGDLWPHLAKEERVLFPAISALAQGRQPFGPGSVASPIGVMTAEHESVGGLLQQLRSFTAGYQAPAEACASYRLLYQRLAALEADTHLHILKENSFLFPAAVALEAGLAGGPA